MKRPRKTFKIVYVNFIGKIACTFASDLAYLIVHRLKNQFVEPSMYL